MKDSNRPRRVAELIKRELADSIIRELRNTRAHHVTLTEVEVTADLSSARVYFTHLGGAAAAKPAAAALNGAAGFLRHVLMRRLVLRTVPELRFYYDESVERGARLDMLIERAISEDKANATKRTK